MRRFALVPCLLLPLLLAACASAGRKDDYNSTVYQYSAVVRWEGILAGMQYLDPLVRAEHPLSDLEVNRHMQYRVTGYNVLSEAEDAQGHRIRVVQIGLVNLHTLAERVLRHREIWRWDPDSKRWWLISPPPSLDGG